MDDQPVVVSADGDATVDEPGARTVSVEDEVAEILAEAGIDDADESDDSDNVDDSEEADGEEEGSGR